MRPPPRPTVEELRVRNQHSIMSDGRREAVLIAEAEAHAAMRQRHRLEAVALDAEFRASHPRAPHTSGCKGPTGLNLAFRKGASA